VTLVTASVQRRRRLSREEAAGGPSRPTDPPPLGVYPEDHRPMGRHASATRSAVEALHAMGLSIVIAAAIADLCDLVAFIERSAAAGDPRRLLSSHAATSSSTSATSRTSNRDQTARNRAPLVAIGELDIWIKDRTLVI
jgi:hypothetical protein